MAAGKDFAQGRDSVRNAAARLANRDSMPRRAISRLASSRRRLRCSRSRYRPGIRNQHRPGIRNQHRPGIRNQHRPGIRNRPRMPPPRGRRLRPVPPSCHGGRPLLRPCRRDLPNQGRLPAGRAHAAPAAGPISVAAPGSPGSRRGARRRCGGRPYPPRPQAGRATPDRLITAPAPDRRHQPPSHRLRAPPRRPRPHCRRSSRPPTPWRDCWPEAAPTGARSPRPSRPPGIAPASARMRRSSITPRRHASPCWTISPPCPTARRSPLPCSRI